MIRIPHFSGAVMSAVQVAVIHFFAPRKQYPPLVAACDVVPRVGRNGIEMRPRTTASATIREPPGWTIARREVLHFQIYVFNGRWQLKVMLELGHFWMRNQTIEYIIFFPRCHRILNPAPALIVIEVNSAVMEFAHKRRFIVKSFRQSLSVPFRRCRPTTITTLQYHGEARGLVQGSELFLRYIARDSRHLINPTEVLKSGQGIPSRAASLRGIRLIKLPLVYCDIAGIDIARIDAAGMAVRCAGYVTPPLIGSSTLSID
mmetsp:Transcript_8521/g.18316  ORF Transcript_8521/g.18316 Transcript_8521/m.18316 type:complete len:260 (+) Transcript_8521:324-1103(+)